MNDSLQPLSPATNRMRRHRERQRNRMRCVTIEVHESEIKKLVRMGFLKSEMRNDPIAISSALYAFFDGTFGSMP